MYILGTLAQHDTTAHPSTTTAKRLSTDTLSVLQRCAGNWRIQRRRAISGRLGSGSRVGRAWLLSAWIDITGVCGLLYTRPAIVWSSTPSPSDRPCCHSISINWYTLLFRYITYIGICMLICFLSLNLLVSVTIDLLIRSTCKPIYWSSARGSLSLGSNLMLYFGFRITL
jgi:hypothetical protein